MGFFRRIESFITRIKLYTKIPPNSEMIETVTEVMVEILFGLVVVNKQTNQGRFSKLTLTHEQAHEAFVKRLLGRNAIEEMLQRLDALTMEESQMMVAQTLEVVTDGVLRLFTWLHVCYLTLLRLR
jgi:hypothetical protein